MTSLAKMVWFFILAVFFVGTNIVWYILAEVILILLVWWLKPEWLDRW